VGATGSAASRISVVPAQRIRFGKGGRNTAMHSLSGELFHLLTPALKFGTLAVVPLEISKQQLFGSNA